MPPEPGYDGLLNACRAVQLDILGAFHPEPGDKTPDGCGTLVLLGPREPGFWAAFTQSPEYRAGTAHPLDRWSDRIIRALAARVQAGALFPFGGPPYQPFIAWALRSGRAWQSPAGPLVHDSAGMMVSYRGALALRERMPLPELPLCPCDTCADRSCVSTCPVGALRRDKGYDVAACHSYLDTDAGTDCMTRGCRARRACPVSKNYGRLEPQSAFHMKAFHP
ncbi:MAG: ferredoxin [Rhodobacter sp.]|nr:ferredoxin [Rhodobacter sp.]